MMRRGAMALVFLASFAMSAAAGEASMPEAEWPWYLGPHGSQSAAECGEPMVESWAEARLLWQSDVPVPDGMSGDGRGPRGRFDVSGGYASPIVAGGLVYLQYYVPSGDVADERLVKEFGDGVRPKFLIEADDVLHAFDARTGKTVFRAVLERTAMNMQGFTKGGPSLTPCVAGGRAYLHSNGGRLFCLDAKDGRKLWEAKTARFEFQEKLRAWAVQNKRIPAYNRDFKTSPAVIGGAVVFNDHRYHKTMAGGGWEYFYDEPSNLVALDAETGRELWRLPGAISNSASPLPWRAGGRELVIAAGGREAGIRCIEPRTGRVLWTIDDAAPGRTPCLAGDILVTQAGEKPGWHVAYRLSEAGPRKLWELDRSYGCPGFATPAAAGGYLYTETNPRGRLLCVEAATGKVVAAAPAEKEGHFGYFPRVMGSRVVCGGADTDQLHLYAAGPDGFRLLDDAKIPNAWGYETPILPALVGGRMYLRTHDRLVCIDLRKGAGEGTPLGESPLLTPPTPEERAAREAADRRAVAKPAAPLPELDDVNPELDLAR